MNAVIAGNAAVPFDILGVIRAVDNKRDYRKMYRRLMKLGEEYGEALQAYLAITSENNYKKLTPGELREELVDIVIVALDLLCYHVPGEENLTDEQLNEVIREVLERKVEKWKRIRQRDEAEARREVPQHIDWGFPEGMKALPLAFYVMHEVQTVDQLLTMVHSDFDLYDMCLAYGYVQ